MIPKTPIKTPHNKVKSRDRPFRITSEQETSKWILFHIDIRTSFLFFHADQFAIVIEEDTNENSINIPLSNFAHIS